MVAVLNISVTCLFLILCLPGFNSQNTSGNLTCYECNSNSNQSSPCKKVDFIAATKKELLLMAVMCSRKYVPVATKFCFTKIINEGEPNESYERGCLQNPTNDTKVGSVAHENGITETICDTDLCNGEDSTSDFEINKLTQPPPIEKKDVPEKKNAENAKSIAQSIHSLAQNALLYFVVTIITLNTKE